MTELEQRPQLDRSTPASEAPMLVSVDSWKPNPPPPGTHSDYFQSTAIEDPLAFHSHSQPPSNPHISGLILSRPPPPSPPSSSGTTDSSMSSPSFTYSASPTPPQQPMHLPHDPLYFDSRATGFWPTPPMHPHMAMPMLGQMPGSIPMAMSMPMPMPMPVHMHPGATGPHLGVGLGLFIPNHPPPGCGPEPYYPVFSPQFTPRLHPYDPPFHSSPPDFQSHNPTLHPRPYGPFFSTPSSPSLSNHRRSSLGRVYGVNPHKPRSQFLDAFANGQLGLDSIQDIKGFVVEFAGDQVGSRFLQVKIERATHDEKQMIFDEIIPCSYQLMTDVFGNYVVQRMFEFGSQAQKAALASAMYGHVLGLSNHVYGCRVVQKALEHILADQQSILISELDGHVVECVKSSHGNHVIQRMLERINPARLTFVVHAITGQMLELSTHPYGCRVLQRAFEHLKSEQTKLMVEELNKHAHQLIQDQFGNYVVQNLIRCGAAEDKRVVIRSLLEHMPTVARHKYASNVCEKALQYSEPEDRRALIEKIMGPLPDSTSSVQLYMRDGYGNYVLQCALRVADDDQKEKLIQLMRPVLGDMRNHNHSRVRHFASIDKLHTEVSRLTISRSEPKATLTVSPESYPSLPPSGKLIELELESPLSESDFTETESEDEWPRKKK